MSAPPKPVPLTTVESTETSESGAQTLTLSVGPQHSGSGHMRLIVEVDGDIIVNVAPDPAIVTRGSKRLSSSGIIIRVIPGLRIPRIIILSISMHPWGCRVWRIQGVMFRQW